MRQFPYDLSMQVSILCFYDFSKVFVSHFGFIWNTLNFRAKSSATISDGCRESMSEIVNCLVVSTKVLILDLADALLIFCDTFLLSSFKLCFWFPAEV